MKIFKQTLMLLAIAGLTNGLIATEKATTKKHVKTKHLEHKKHTPIKTHHKITSKASTPKTHHKITTKAATPHTAKVKKSVPAQTKAATPTTQSTSSKGSNWFGLGAATTAATTAAADHVVNHRGPADWHKKHHFPAGWKDGFTGKWVGNEWLFAGHTLAWWHEYEPAYYRDVVRPEATKAGVPRQHFAHELIKRK